MTIAIYFGAVALGLICITLFVLSARRLLGRQEEIVTTMLLRYDERLAEFAQTLTDALNQPLPARILAAISEPAKITPAVPDHGDVMRLLEIARNTTSSDAAVAIVANGEREPMLATVGLTQAEAAQVGRLGIPDYRGARAIQVSFTGESETPAGSLPIRSGLAVPLLDPPNEPGMLAVLSRSDRRFGDPDITTLEDVITGTKPALESSLELREADPVPQRDALTDLYDRRAFHALLEREIVKTRTAGEPLALLMLDVDRLTTLNAQIGYLAADAVLAEIAERLRNVTGRTDIPCRIGGGRFAVLMPSSDGRDAERLFERLQLVLRDRPIPEAPSVSTSGGIAELLAFDDAAALLGRADAALGLAKGSGRDTAVIAGKR
jgi:diguanylate cyclase (GGDEF)-like protein